MVSRLARPGACRGGRASFGPGRRSKSRNAGSSAGTRFGMCSWPPEDDRIESFHSHVRDQAKAILGSDLARVEKFTTSVMDGIDIRETLRNWHTGDLYVKVLPPSRGSIEAVVFLFELPADPAGLHPSRHLVRRARRGIDAGLLRDRPHEEPRRARESPRPSTAGRSSSFHPGRSPTSGPTPGSTSPTRSKSGCSPRPSCTATNGTSRSSARDNPAASWRRLARRYGRKIVHLPLKRFSGQLLERLRTFHVLNGKQVRSYAADYIRDL